ncbi:Diacylglycerol kinase [hydrothermal vent metagenome]|uniref:Diacylglycerol kinase n=1 Tax=hydrothermal vent metagenome TaxID=652676 RepID=A0A3B1B1L5_9ZZZZ
MAKPGATGLTRIINAYGYSMKGLRAAFINESAFRQEFVLALVLTPLAIWVGHNAVEYILLIGSALLVLVVELLNSAIEAVVDRIGDEHHDLSGRAKDIGSAAVLISLGIVALVWVLIIFQHYLG